MNDTQYFKSSNGDQVIRVEGENVYVRDTKTTSTERQIDKDSQEYKDFNANPNVQINQDEYNQIVDDKDADKDSKGRVTV